MPLVSLVRVLQNHPMKTPSHKWTFRSCFRANTFGWRGSKLAIERLKEAIGEIKAVARTAPATAAEGAILLMERLWPALQGVDSSSGALGNATSKTVRALIEILLAAPADGAVLERRLARLWTAIEEDGVDFVSEVADRWGELCRTPERASRAADNFLPAVRLSSTAWSDGLPPSNPFDAPITRDGCHRAEGREALRRHTTPGRTESVSISKTRRVAYAAPPRPQETQGGRPFEDKGTAENQAPRNEHSAPLFQF